MAEMKTLNGYEIVDEQTRGRVSHLEQVPTDDKYFDIDVDGVICLKSEYRGNPPVGGTVAGAYPYSISDNKAGNNGSKFDELPECIVIPENVNGEKVTGFQKGIFAHNLKIKKVVFPSTVKTVINAMFREAFNLEKVENTEHIETISAGGFYMTRVEELRFPNLKSLAPNAFHTCSCLRVVDIGKVTSIGNYMFYQCENLVEVVGENVTQIGNAAFYLTRRLKSLPFTSKLTLIKDGAFWGSRCDLDDVPDTCSVGNYATYKKYESNDISQFADYWSAATFAPCRNTLNSLFHQKDPRWVDKQIGNFYKKDDDGNVTTEPVLYGGGCAYITLAEMYSAFENVSFDSPEEFIPILESALAAKGHTNLDLRYRDDWVQAAQALGYETQYFSTMTTENLQTAYTALANGALLYKSTMGKLDGVDDGAAVQGGHVHLAYGINTDGEMLVSDTCMPCYNIGIYENHKTAWHIYKHGSKNCDCVVVTKPSEG